MGLSILTLSLNKVQVPRDTWFPPGYDGVMATDDRSLPLRERKRLRTRHALAATALRLFSEKGFDATTLDELVDEVEVSRSTFFRAFPTKEAVAIEAETELWSRFLVMLADRALSGTVLDELRDALTDAANALDPDWDRRYVATRRLITRLDALISCSTPDAGVRT